ncbi:hypothetical protein HPP92_012607 [Vanilla planifolia]|uniref:Uncharacterized protein n=1 Tax=Vanilla planifolia TaxID=51239 RepID=A0A835R0S2_VANPL|nr:hypothetical protein HPP92_012607 [Vanilla planifolia]
MAIPVEEAIAALSTFSLRVYGGFVVETTRVGMVNTGSLRPSIMFEVLKQSLSCAASYEDEIPHGKEKLVRLKAFERWQDAVAFLKESYSKALLNLGYDIKF